ncbi:MAG TPA: hypothetical protein VGP73_29575 [Thermoanaerobaculia bacterium]
MPKHSSTPKRPRDFNARAFDSVARLTGTALPEVDPEDEPIASLDVAREEKPEKNPAAVALGRLGGLKGGKARLTKLSPEKRREIAKAAAAARWNKKP